MPSSLSSDERKQLSETVDKLNLSEDEAKNFNKAFSDPEFLKMFGDYVQEISDPRNRMENDMYLRQVESEGRVEDVYGKGVELIMPKAGLCIKTCAKMKSKSQGAKKKATSKRTVYVNICHSEKVQDYELVPAQGGSNLSLPFSLGSSRDEYTLDNEPRLPAPVPPSNMPELPEGAKLQCTVHDLVVGTKTFEDAVRKPALKKALVEVALENVDKHFYSDELDANGDIANEAPSKRGGKLDVDKATILSETVYKTDAHDGNPSVQAIRTDKSSEQPQPGDRIKPDNHGPATDAERDVAEKVAQAEKNAQPAAHASKPSPFSFDNALKRQQKAPAKQEPKVNELGEAEPRYEMVHRDVAVDIESAWSGSSAGEAAYQADVRRKQRRVLIVRVHLEKCKSMADVLLDVTSTTLKLRKPDLYCLELKLPCAVKDDEGKAKFDKAKRVLEVTLPKQQEVVAVSKPPESTTAAAAVTPTTTASPSDAPALVQEIKSEDAPEPEPEPELEEPSSSSMPQAQPEETASIAEETENQRRWREIHESQNPPAVPPPQTSSDDAVAPTEKKSVSFSAVAPPSANSKPGKSDDDDGDDDDDDDELPEMPALEAMDGQDAVESGAGDFVASSKFTGARPGYVFRTGSSGVGYYRDVPLSSTSSAPASLTSRPKAPEAEAPAPTPVKTFIPTINHACIDEMD